MSETTKHIMQINSDLNKISGLDGIISEKIKNLANQVHEMVVDILSNNTDSNNNYYSNIKIGDDIYYVDEEYGKVEHGKISSVLLRNNEIYSFGVNFDNGDFDEFCGGALGYCCFTNKYDAYNVLIGGK